MSKNFEFLMVEADTAVLFETANLAEKNYTHKDYEGTLTKVRKLAEEAVSLVLEKEAIILPSRTNFNNKLNEAKLRISEQYIIQAFYDIKKLGNLAAHEVNTAEATQENALKALNHIFVILVWFVKKYTSTDIQMAYMDFLEPEAERLYQAAERKLIYIQTVNNESGMFQAYEGTQKIGEATAPDDDFEVDWSPNSEFLRTVGARRINQYMKTAGLKFVLEWVELAWKKSTKTWFHDHDVHEVLKRSGIKKPELLDGSEWFKTDLDTAKEAIKAVKEGRSALQTIAETAPTYEIKLRPEQENAITKTKDVFKKKNNMLWNAKMRFGKTLTSLQLIKDEKYQKVLIMTHRPVVSDSWFEAFGKMKMADEGYDFGSKDKGENLENLKRGNSPFIYFVSIQKLRYGGGETNLAEFSDIDWNLIIIDEAGVKEAKAFEKLLNEHRVFGQEYNIVNVVKDDKSDNTEVATEGDLEKVRNAITNDPSQTKTITLTVRKLTTGVNIPEWTAVLFLSNTNSAMNYLQAAFRAQTSFSDEKLGMKKNCYIFDFAPDRALSVMAESAQVNSGVGKKNTQEQKDMLTRLLNFMPILGNSEMGMTSFNVDKMLTQLKKVYAEKAVRSGFEDDSLYNDRLLTLTEGDTKVFQDLNAIVGKTQGQKKVKITISENGLSDEEYDKGEKAKKKPARQRTTEEKEAIDKINEAKKQRKTMISILRGVSIRIPMMIYGMKLDLAKDISIQDFVKEVDDESWKEFMPKGFTKGMFKQIVQYYDAEVFVEAGRIIRQRAKSYDQLDFIERAEKIAELFSTFKNPDKETVLTPWRVVNLQLTKTIGGLNFFDDEFVSTTDGAVSNLHWVERNDTDKIYTDESKFLEINTKTGLYPLHVAMSLYYQAVNKNEDIHFEADEVYKKILKENIFAIAKTEMAKTITERTLAGYKNFKTNVQYIDGFVEAIKESSNKGKEKVEETFKNVKFDVVIGNPPYQNEGAGDVGRRDEPVYNKFMDTAYEIADRVVLITPARFLFNAGQTPKAWNKKMLEDKHLKVVYYTQDSSKVFPNTDIKGGVAVTYRSVSNNFGAIETFTHFEELNSMLIKTFEHTRENNFSEIVFSSGEYSFTTRLFEDFPEARNLQGKGTGAKITSASMGRMPFAFLESVNDENEYYKLLGRINNERVYRWIKREYIEKTLSLDKWNVLVPKANGSGALGEVLSTPLIGQPLIGHTDTFLTIGAFDTELEAENCMKYIKSKFARAMLGVLKITQDNPKSVWKKIPLQDFTPNSDIDWTKSIPEIDQQLYAKYGLSQDEIDFIEEKVKAME
ncbi:Eco57I restriction-modification methylase domain-containing protein [Lactococcus cremoris]|uniref:Eco57I restriction-modification methylase domain-containing protein n=1 Tax=Lactococcus lactis subsp. cremoris TaxID=1359 RepID=UPI002FCA53B1